MGKWKRAKENKEKEELNEETRYILSIDGGGMRGLIPSYILTKCESLLKEIGDERPLYSHFDLISGTSTGALIALGLTCPTENTSFESNEEDNFVLKEEIIKKKFLRKKREEVEVGEIKSLASAKDLLKIYQEKGGEIFKSNTSLLRKISQLISEKYDAADFERFLYLTFKDTPLSEAYVPTMAVSFNTEKGEPYIFRSWDSKGFLINAAARATSAAPTYFSPVSLIEPDTNDRIVLIDGGVAANNPVLLSYNEARTLYPNATKFVVLSLSTCSNLFTFDPLDSVSGLAGWANNIWQVYASGSMAVADETARSIKDLDYIRLWTKIAEKKIKMDDYSPEAIKCLEDGAEKLWMENKETLKDFFNKLKDEKTHSSVKLSPLREALPSPLKEN